MQVVHTVAELRAAIAELRDRGARVAFVPTMGALHDGHLALVEEAGRRADAVVVSVFVNPLQFGVHEDLARYPRDLAADVVRLDAHHVTLLFAPAVAEMYPPGRITSVSAAPHDAGFEGRIRPGHFTGVLTIVTKLFNLVAPDIAVFGQKDLQQLALVRAMVRDLDIPVEIIAVPTVREADGLAMSSRNRYLSPADRQRATRLHSALRAVQSAFESGTRSAAALEQIGSDVLTADTVIAVDYLAIVDPGTFTPVDPARPGDAVIVAARIGGTHLIDNIIL